MASAKITLPCEGPEVRGSAAWITPTSVEWRVMSSRWRADGLVIYVDAIVTGRGRDGRHARGAAIFSEGASYSEPVPDWIPRPDEWIERAIELVTSAHHQENPDAQ